MDNKAIYEQLAKVQKQVEKIAKDQKNEYNNYMFRGIDDYYNYFNSLFKENEILILPEVLSMKHEVLPQGNKYKTKVFYNVKYTYLSLIDGSSVYVTMAGEGDDSGDKSTGKAMSNSFKYALAETFIVPTKDIKDSDQFEPPKKQEQKEPAFNRNTAIKYIDGLMHKFNFSNEQAIAIQKKYTAAKTRADFVVIQKEVEGE